MCWIKTTSFTHPNCKAHVCYILTYCDIRPAQPKTPNFINIGRESQWFIAAAVPYLDPIEFFIPSKSQRCPFLESKSATQDNCLSFAGSPCLAATMQEAVEGRHSWDRDRRYLGVRKVDHGLWVKIKSRIAGLRIGWHVVMDERKQRKREEEEMWRETMEVLEQTMKSLDDLRLN